MNVSSKPKIPILRRMYVLNVTVMIDAAKKIDEMITIASGSPSGAISLAEGSTPFEAMATVDPG
jgi:hypothetical protein